MYVYLCVCVCVLLYRKEAQTAEFLTVVFGEGPMGMTLTKDSKGVSVDSKFFCLTVDNIFISYNYHIVLCCRCVVLCCVVMCCVVLCCVVLCCVVRCMVCKIVFCIHMCYITSSHTSSYNVLLFFTLCILNTLLSNNFIISFKSFEFLTFSQYLILFITSNSILI